MRIEYTPRRILLFHGNDLYSWESLWLNEHGTINGNIGRRACQLCLNGV